MRPPPIQPLRRTAAFVLTALLWSHAVCARAQSDAHPLAPPDLSSPRAALTNFLALMNGAYSHWKTEGRTYQNRIQRAAIARLAHQFFDLNDIAPSVRNNVGRETAVFTYCYHPPNSTAFTAFNEKITLRILESMAHQGIQLSRQPLSGALALPGD